MKNFVFIKKPYSINIMEFGCLDDLTPLQELLVRGFPNSKTNNKQLVKGPVIMKE